MESYKKNGDPVLKIMFKNGVRNGIEEYYFDMRYQLQTKITFKDDVWEGPWGEIL